MTRKVVHIFPSKSWGGAEIYMLELAEEQTKLARENNRKRHGSHDETEILLWVPSGSALDVNARARGLNVINDACPFRFSVVALFQIPAVIRREKITDIVAHWSGAVWALAGLKFFGPWPRPRMILHFHMWISRKKRDLLHRFLYSNFDFVIVAGARARIAALNALPVSSEKLVTIPYAIRPPVSAPTQPATQTTAESFRAEQHWPTDAVVFAMFARWDKQKGQREFIQAAQILLKEPALGAAAKMRLVLIGDATAGEPAALEYQKSVQDEIAADSVLSAITYQAGFRADFIALLSACDVLVAPSYHESYALILLHAFSLGVPVLSTDSGGTPDLVLDASGWLVPPERVPELADVMRTILTSPTLIKEKKAAAKLQVRDQHSFGFVLSEYEKLLSARR